VTQNINSTFLGLSELKIF